MTQSLKVLRKKGKANNQHWYRASTGLEVKIRPLPGNKRDALRKANTDTVMEKGLTREVVNEDNLDLDILKYCIVDWNIGDELDDGTEIKMPLNDENKTWVHENYPSIAQWVNSIAYQVGLSATGNMEAELKNSQTTSSLDVAS